MTDDAVNKKDPQWSPDGRTIVFSGRHPDDHLYASGIFSVPSAGGPVTRLTPVDAATNLSPRWSPAGVADHLEARFSDTGSRCV